MNEGSKKKFMTAIFGEDGTQVDTATAAALLAATCSGGEIHLEACHLQPFIDAQM